MNPDYVVLASASPRRAALLRRARIPYRVRPADIDETVREGEGAHDCAARLARAKAAAVTTPMPVLAADTVVSVDRRLLGKPRDRDEFTGMLRSLSGREHQVVTAVALRWGDRVATGSGQATVAFRELEEAEIAAYWRSGEPQDKAGGYGIQGIGGVFVRHLTGSYTAVVGLPLAETEALFVRFGIDTWRWRSLAGETARP